MRQNPSGSVYPYQQPRPEHDSTEGITVSETHTEEAAATKSLDFIRATVTADRASGKFAGRVATRFPPADRSTESGMAGPPPFLRRLFLRI